MAFRLRSLIAATFAAFLTLGCVTVLHDEPYDGPYEDGPYVSARSCRVPPGHLPPPGACRIWYPDRPPGHQPPPGDCEELSYRVPHGACLVSGE
jgi:hypothetical protein